MHENGPVSLFFLKKKKKQAAENVNNDKGTRFVKIVTLQGAIQHALNHVKS